MKKSTTSILALGALIVLVAPPAMIPGVDAQSPSLPNSIAGLGDSITQAMNANRLMDQPQHSWSYGDNKRDEVNSHYERILAENRGIRGNYHREAVSGAKMADLNGQAQDAVTAGAEYVTVLMGANDVCTSSKDAMTSPEEFEAQLRQAADTLTAGVPGATVYVLSIPDVYHLWDLFKDDSDAQRAWRMYNICQSMLSTDNTEQDRQDVRERNMQFNAILETVVNEKRAAGHDWHWDGHALFDYAFQESDVSTIDYFHPSVSGQATLAEISWTLGPFGS